MPEVKTRDGVQTDVFVSARGAFETAVDRLTSLMTHTTQSTQTFRYVMIEQIHTRVLVVPQISRGQVGHAGGLLVIICHHIIHVHVRVCELLKRSVICAKHRGTNQEPLLVHIYPNDDIITSRLTCSERIPVDDSRQESPESPHRKASDESSTDLFSLESSHWLWCYTYIWSKRMN